ncbi:MAG: RsmD family RNA methyltransferase [Bacteriovoracaceae bacterium]|nr:RsmD family RNA methyltransferase [Bacteriovoracaceae bacterium]
MSLKILGGFAKGFPIKTPKSADCTTRPTLALLKRRLFDRYQDLSDNIFIDACAGTGAIGMEAWSRGASCVYCIENGAVAKKILRNNIEALKDSYHVEFSTRSIDVIYGSFVKWLQHFCKKYLTWDKSKQKKVIIFFDPPYTDTLLYELVIAAIDANAWFKGEVWLESDELKGLPLAHWREHRLTHNKMDKHYKQGSSYILILQY